MKSRISRTQCYDILKVLTQLLVVLGHVTRMYVGDGAFTPANTSLGLGICSRYIYGFHMPLYMLLSGCVYGYCIGQGKYQRALPFIGNKARRILLPYLLIGSFWVTPVMWYTGLTSDWRSYLLQGILLGGNSRHLWFLLTLFWIFVLACLVRRVLLKHPAVVLAVSVGLCLVSQSVPYFPYVYGILQLRNVLYYQLFFVGGVCVNRWYERIAECFEKCRWVLLLLIPAGLGAVWLSTWPWKLFWTLPGLAGMFGLVLCAPKQAERLQNTRLYRWIKQNNFGIYLFHPMLIYLAFYWFGGCNVNPWLFSIAVFLISFFLSGLFAALLRRLHLKFIIGE